MAYDITDETLLFLALADEDHEDDELRRRCIGSIGILVFVGMEQSCYECSEQRQSRRTYLIRSDLLPDPHLNTPWQALYSAQNNHAFITTMGVDVPTFHYILSYAVGALGLVLHWLNSTMRDVSLMQIFALVLATVSRYLHFSLTILLHALKSIPEAYIQWPSGDDFQVLNELVIARHPLLMGGFGTLDRLNLPVQTSQDQEIENATYNGWLHNHFVSSVIAFSADGSIIQCRLNAPGSWHDSRTDQIAGRIKAPLKAGQCLPNDPAERQKLLSFDQQLLSFHQTAEWGMHALQGSFERLRIPLNIHFSEQHCDLLEVCVRLNNVHVGKVGISQIRSVYMPIWQEGKQDRMVWAEFESMVFSDQHHNDRVAQFHLSSRNF
ncbi:hypothetical protein BDR04DRAFT_1137636 [Suillus decipiens]|nr:hypothetical protein BDR04DRAFT_1137636 [Suillus decipiens]